MLKGLTGGSQTVVVDARGRRLPLEIEERVYWLDLDPPGTALHGLTDKAGVVAWSNNKLVAVLDVGIFEGNFAERLCFSDRFLVPFQLHLPKFYHLVLSQRRDRRICHLDRLDGGV